MSKSRALPDKPHASVEELIQRHTQLAGARGDTSARIFSTNFGPELVSIAGVYRTFERGIPQTVAGRGAQVRLTGSDNLHTLEITPLQYD